MTLTLAVLLRENMTQMRVATLETTARRALKTLGGTTICFEFWQCFYLVIYVNCDLPWD